jgi:hypothetical protein
MEGLVEAVQDLKLDDKEIVKKLSSGTILNADSAMGCFAPR